MTDTEREPDAKALYHSLVEGLPLGIARKDRRGRFTFANRRFCAMLGRPPEEVGGGSEDDFYPPEVAAAHREQDARVLRTGESLETVEERTTPTGKRYWQAVRAPVRGGDGEVIGIQLTYWDVTAHKRAEEELRRATEEAAAASRAKSEFLANMSHEIRTPMTAILGFTDVLLEEGNLGDAPPQRVEALHTIKRNGDHLLEVINDILDLSKIEAGRLEVECVPCSPARIVEDVAELMRVRAESKGLELTVEYTSPIPETIRTDPTRLRQVLLNLLGNAVKFTEKGTVWLLAGLRRGAVAAEPVMVFGVIDSGIGMTAEQVGKLFRPFVQGDASTTRKYGGTGLGLTISKRLAGLLGGDIAVESAPGQGSTFVLTLPTGPLEEGKWARDAGKLTPAPTPRLPPPPPARGARVLLAEDGPDNQRLIVFHLKRAGAEVTVAENGQLAVEHALTAQAGGRPFDVVLMDMQMPVLDGYGATRELRQRGYAGPVLALTAHAMEGDRAKCLSAGCDDYLTKPIDRKKLLEAVAARLGRAPDGPPCPPARSSSPCFEESGD